MKRILLLCLLTIAAASNTMVAAGQGTQKAADHVPEQKTSGLDQVILEEYKALRAEIILSLEGRVSIVSLGFAAIGALLAGGVAALTRDKPYWLASALIIGIGVTLTSIYVLDVWTAETRRLLRASNHNCYLENKINDLFPGNVKPLEWEHRLRNDEAYKSFLPSDKETPWIFLVVSLCSAVGGSILFWWGANKKESPRLSRYRVPIILPVGLLLLWDIFLRWDDLHNLKTIWSRTTC
jgi:hypothetical protein